LTTFSRLANQLCYALFTLVGIAREDDLDAPDFTASTVANSGHTSPVALNKTAGMNGGREAGRASIRRNGKTASVAINLNLTPTDRWRCATNS
jgi:hypothetical protein